MAESRKIFFISAEVAPFAKTGGLGDIGGSLPKALHELGHDVRVVMPAYRNIESGYPDVVSTGITFSVPTGIGPIQAGLFEGTLPDSDVPVYFIAEQFLFNRDKIYGYEDDAYRFAFFCRAAMELIPMWDWKPDVVHAHDWHTAPALVWLATAGQVDGRYRSISSVFTIHNLAHQGKTDWAIFDYMGIQTHALHEETYGEVNFMARGIYHATMVNTVSPTYAREIMTYEGGAGLHSLLNHRRYDVHGILNGLDTDDWNPATDARIATNYTAETLDQRIHNKRALQAMANLPQNDNIPLIAMVSRLDWQKGMDIMGHVIHLLMNNTAGEAQFVLLGTGEANYENMFRNLESYHPHKMRAILAYNAGMAPGIYAGSDMFLMPSLFEPCGLGQLISMRYGSVPVVRATGGLVDTVKDGQTGFVFSDYSADAFWVALARAIYVYNVDRPRWREIQQAGMDQNFSWEASGRGYEQLYEWAISRTNSY